MVLACPRRERDAVAVVSGLCGYVRRPDAVNKLLERAGEKYMGNEDGGGPGKCKLGANIKARADRNLNAELMIIVKILSQDKRNAFVHKTPIQVIPKFPLVFLSSLT